MLARVCNIDYDREMPIVAEMNEADAIREIPATFHLKNLEETEMAKKIIRSDKVWQHKMSWSYGAVIDPGSKIVMVSGAIPVDREGNLVGKGNLKAQITQIVKNMAAILEAGGATLNDVVFMRMYTTDVEEWIKTMAWRSENYPELWGKTLGDQTAAAQTLIGVTRLGIKDVMLEIEAVAAI